jgi:hypothetical protein
MPEIAPIYTEMRARLLGVKPADGDLAPSAQLPHVYGAVIDLGFEIYMSVVAFADGTTSMYNAIGGAAVGLGDVEIARAAASRLLESVEAAPELPEPARVRVTALTYEGRRTTEVEGPGLLRGGQPLSIVFANALRLLAIAQQLTATTPPAGEA